MPSILSSLKGVKILASMAIALVLAGGVMLLKGGGDDKAARSSAPAVKLNLEQSFAGRWNVRYYDRYLGPVYGHAFIDKNGKKGWLELEYPQKAIERYTRTAAPAFDAVYTLSIEGVKPTSSGITLDVVGEWPGAPFGSAQDIGLSLGEPEAWLTSAQQKAETAYQNATLSITLDGKKEKLTFESSNEAPQEDIVHVTLRPQAGSFAGRWHYQASNWRGVEADGNGRIYKLKRDADGSMKAFGYETWTRPNPVIELVAPLTHFNDNLKHPAHGGNDDRNILILGKDLPDPRYETLQATLIGDATGEKSFGYSFTKPDAHMLKQSLRGLKHQLSDADYKRIETGVKDGKLDAILVKAHFGKNARPGLTHFKMSDGRNVIEIPWLLTFEDYFADMQFARKLVDASSLEPLDEPAPTRKEGQSEKAHREALAKWAARREVADQDVYEPTSTLFTPDSLYIVLYSEKELPYMHVPLMVGHGENIITFNGGKTLFAKKDKAMPTRYVAGPIAISASQQDVLQPGSYYPDTFLPENARISVRVHQTHSSLKKKHWLLKTKSPIISAEIIGSPQDDEAIVKGQRRKLFTTWPSAYEVVRNCYEHLTSDEPRYSTIDDPYYGGSLKVDEYTHYIVNNVFQGKDITRSTALLMGDHAAMLLLRDTYLAMMERQRVEMIRAKKNLFGFYKLMRPHSHMGNIPREHAASIMRQMVTMPSGKSVLFYDAYYRNLADWAQDDDPFAMHIKPAIESIAAQAIDGQLKDIEANMAMVRSAHRCNKNQLIEMTQRYYRIVAPQTFKKLYKQPKEGGPYQADGIARAWVRGLYWLSENQRTEEQLNTADTYMLMGEVAAVGLIPAAIGTASSLGSAGVAYLAGTSGTAVAASSTATAALAAESAFTMAGLWSAIIAAVEVVDLGYSAYMTYNDLSQYHEDLAFARTSQAIMGYHQYKALEEQRYSKYGWAGFDAVLGAIGAHGTGHAIMHAGRSLKSFSNASQLVHKAFIGDALALYARRGTLLQDSAQWASHSLGAARETGGLIYQNMHRKIVDALTGSKVVPNAKNQRTIVRQVKALMKHNGLDAAAHSDEALLEMAQRLGTEQFTQAARQNYPDAMARRRTSYAIMDALTGANTNAVDRVLSGAELAQTSTQARKYLARMYAEIQALPQAERELFAQWLRQFENLGGDGVLNHANMTRQVRDVMMVYNHLQTVFNERLFSEFASELSSATYARVRGIMHPTLRKPLEGLITENPSRFTALFESDIGERVLRGNAFENLDQYERAIELEKKRVRTPNPNGWKEIAEGKPPRGLYTDEVIGHMHDGGLQQVVIDVSTNWNWGKHSNRFARFERRVNNIENFSAPLLRQMDELGLPKAGKVFTFASAKIDDLQIPQRIVHARDAALTAYRHATGTTLDTARKAFKEAQSAYDKAAEYALSIQKRTMLSNMKNPMIKGKGTPLAAYLNQRAMHLLGIGFGDPALKMVKLEHVLNKKTALQLHWLQRVYQDGRMPLEEMLSYTDSYRYAESALNQAGFRITGAKLANRGKVYEMAGFVSDFAANTNSHSFGKEGLSGFLKRFSGIDPKEEIEMGFDMYLTVAPM